MTDRIDFTPEPVDLPTPNLPLLRKVLDHIDAHPEQWDQNEFAVAAECGTVACIAGHAVAMTVGLNRTPGGRLRPANGRSFDGTAMEILGLTENESDDLFYNTIDGDTITVSQCRDQTVRQRVQAVAERIAARAGERL